MLSSFAWFNFVLQLWEEASTGWDGWQAGASWGIPCRHDASNPHRGICLHIVHPTLQRSLQQLWRSSPDLQKVPSSTGEGGDPGRRGSGTDAGVGFLPVWIFPPVSGDPAASRHGQLQQRKFLVLHPPDVAPTSSLALAFPDCMSRLMSFFFFLCVCACVWFGGLHVKVLTFLCVAMLTCVRVLYIYMFLCACCCFSTVSVDLL